MRLIVIFGFVFIGVSVLSAQENAKEVGDLSFDFKDNTWVMTGLPESFTIEEGYFCKYKDEIWEKWYATGDDMLKQILDLGPNVIFKMKSSVDGQEHIFSVSQDGKPLSPALVAGSKKGISGFVKGLSTAGKVGLGAAGVGATALIISNANSNDEASKAKR